MNFYKVEIVTADKRRHTEFVAAEDELKAMDKVVEHYKGKEILDIKVF
jgi:hypothetical protein